MEVQMSSIQRPHVRTLAAATVVAVLMAGATMFGTAAAAATARARHSASGLPSVSSGPRPGPAILYAKPPRAPQLENTGVWKAPPILVSGADAYRDGEWLYQ